MYVVLNKIKKNIFFSATCQSLLFHYFYNLKLVCCTKQTKKPICFQLFTENKYALIGQQSENFKLEAKKSF